MAWFWRMAFGILACSLLAGASWCLPLAQQPHDDVEARFRAAQQEASAGRYDHAVKDYQEILRWDPSLVEARFNLALAYHSLGEYRSAIRELEKVVSERPDLTGANLFLGIDYLKTKAPGKAVAPLETVLRADPQNRVARKALATAHVELGDYRQALNEFRALATSDPDRANGLYELGQCYLDLAKKVANYLSEAAPNSVWANRLAGDLKAASGQPADAVILYRRALAADPTQPGLHTSLGNAELKQGRLDRAKENFEAELRLDAGDKGALLGLAELDLVNGAPQKALDRLSKIEVVHVASLDLQKDFPLVTLAPEIARSEATKLEACPDSLWKHFFLASLYRLAGEEERYRQHWEAWNRDLVASEETDNSGAHDSGAGAVREPALQRREEDVRSAKSLNIGDGFRLGYTLYSRGEFQKSADTFAATLSSGIADLQTSYWLAQDYLRLADGCFSRLIQEFPESWRAYEFVAISSELRYSSEASISEFQTAIRLNPNDAELHQKLGELYYARKSYARAEEEFRKSLQLDAGEARSLYLLGRIRLDQRQTNESIPYFLSAIRYNPDLMEAHAALGQAYMRLGQAERAVPELTKAAAIDNYGDLHYLLYVAYRKLGKPDLAQQALARSQALRKITAAEHQAKVDEAAREEAR